MKVIIHDTDEAYNRMFDEICDTVIYANGLYAPCQGCFGCWTKHPAECWINDHLKEICRIIGRADELILITENCYGTYSPPVKNVIDLSNGNSPPLSTYRGRQMHHTLRYGTHKLFKVIAYGDMTVREQKTLRLFAQRNAINQGYEASAVYFLEERNQLEALEL